MKTEGKSKGKTKEKKEPMHFMRLFEYLAIPDVLVSFFVENIFGISITLFLLIETFLLVLMVCCGCLCYQEYSTDKSRLIIQCRKYESNKSGYSFELDDLKIKYRKKFFSVFFQIIGKHMLTILAVILIFCASHPDNAKSYFNHMKALIGLENHDEDRNNMIKEDEFFAEEKQEEVFSFELQERETKPSEWRFILDVRDESEFENLEREQQVFFDCSNGETTWETFVQEYVKAICDEERKGVDYTKVRDENGNSFYTYTELEDSFKDKIWEVIGYQNYDDWLRKAPHSTEMDYYIFGREHLNQIDCEGERGCYKLWYQLANDYQYFAQEYERQTDNKKAVRYNYINSIYCCMQGLRYSVSKGDKEYLYHYMVMRYHDMADKRSKVPDEDRIKASKIYSILVKEDCLSTLDEH